VRESTGCRRRAGPFQVRVACGIAVTHDRRGQPGGLGKGLARCLSAQRGGWARGCGSLTTGGVCRQLRCAGRTPEQRCVAAANCLKPPPVSPPFPVISRPCHPCIDIRSSPSHARLPCLRVNSATSSPFFLFATAFERLELFVSENIKQRQKYSRLDKEPAQSRKSTLTIIPQHTGPLAFLNSWPVQGPLTRRTRGSQEPRPPTALSLQKGDTGPSFVSFSKAAVQLEYIA
jgi:hypothetical protein